MLLTTVGGLILCFLIFLLVYGVRGIAEDARARGKDALPVVLLCILCFPLGLLIWIVFRPEPLEPSEQPFRLEDHRAQ